MPRVETRGSENKKENKTKLNQDVYTFFGLRCAVMYYGLQIIYIYIIPALHQSDCPIHN